MVLVAGVPFFSDYELVDGKDLINLSKLKFRWLVWDDDSSFFFVKYSYLEDQ